MKHGSMIAGIALLALGACASEPQYPVRPGEPRAEFPKPTYPVRAQDSGLEPSPTAAPQPVRPAPTSAASVVETNYYKPEPIKGAPPPPDERGAATTPALHAHAAPSPAKPLRPSPAPTLEAQGEVIVRPGENLFEVAERVRAPVRALIELNGLKAPYEVAPGARLKVPKPTVYVVQSGDTLFSIGRKFSVDPRSLAKLNDISMESGLKPGQHLALPAAVTERGARAVQATVEPEATDTSIKGKKSNISPPPSVHPTPAAVPPEPEPEPPSAASMVEAGKGKFAWPIKGDILSTFGPKGPGQRNDGVNIAATTGDSVKAAASGQVVYAGSTIPGFGNLVVVKHPDGWTSLYGNLGKISVKIKADVAKGQEIGLAGLSGPVERPQVHFEVRYAATPQDKARPVDPQQLLP